MKRPPYRPTAQDHVLANALSEIDHLLSESASQHLQGADHLARVAATMRATAKDLTYQREVINGLRNTVVSADDLLQEALTWLVEDRHGLVATINDPALGYGVLAQNLCCDYLNYSKPFVTNPDHPSELSLDAIMEPGGGGDALLSSRKQDGAPRPHKRAQVVLEEPWESMDSELYTPAMLRLLLPTLWGCYQGVRSGGGGKEDARAEQRRATTNRAASGSQMAAVVDTARAWEESNLTLGQRQALFLHIGLDWTQEDAAELLGISDRRVREAVKVGLATMAKWLNGPTVTVGDFGKHCTEPVTESLAA